MCSARARSWPACSEPLGLGMYVFSGQRSSACFRASGSGLLLCSFQTVAFGVRLTASFLSPRTLTEGGLENNIL